MLARNHGQPASTTTFGKEMKVFHQRIVRGVADWKQVLLCAKWNGAVGNFNAHVAALPDVDWLEVSRRFIEESVGLVWSPLTTQIESHESTSAYLDA